MLDCLPLLIFSALLATVGVSGTLTRPQSYAVWAADSAIKRGQGNGLSSTGVAQNSYEHGEFQWGLRLLYERTGNKTYYDYIVTGASRIVTDAGAIQGGYVYGYYRVFWKNFRAQTILVQLG
jgi:rhamnogalacturonyl hydrolase YesR